MAKDNQITTHSPVDYLDEEDSLCADNRADNHESSSKDKQSKEASPDLDDIRSAGL